MYDSGTKSKLTNKLLKIAKDVLTKKLRLQLPTHLHLY